MCTSEDYSFNNDNEFLQNELLELSELYRKEESEDEDLDMLENPDEVDFENDLDLVEQSEPDLLLSNPLLKSYREDFGNVLFANTIEENGVILQCEDTTLQSFLITNRLKSKQLKRMHYQLCKILCDCLETAKSSVQKKVSVLSIPRSHIWKLGIPYFKDKQFFPCPDNSDVIKKRSNKEYSMIEFREGRRWTSIDQNLLEKTIEYVFYQQRYDYVRHRIKICKIQIEKCCKKDETAAELFNLNEEFNELKTNKTKRIIPPYYLETDLDWYNVADVFHGTRTPNECKALWNIYLHPHINKTLWTQEENEKIKQLARKYTRQNWDAIAKELDTKRSGYLVFLHYFTNLWNKFKSERFSPSEDRHLLRVIDECRIGNYIPWQKVAFAFRDRAKHQLYHRYTYYLSKQPTKGMFTEAEDVLLLYLIKKFGKDYAKCAVYIPNRTAIQLRNRHSTYLNNWVNRGNYTQMDDKLILEYAQTKEKKNWAIIAAQLNRTRSHVRQRYFSLLKWLGQPNCTLANMPRRQHNIVLRQHFERFNRIHEVAKMLDDYDGDVTLSVVDLFLNSYDPSDDRVNIRSLIRKTGITYYDTQIIEFFKGTCKIQREYKSYKPVAVLESAERIVKLVRLLSANLEITLNPVQQNVSDREQNILTTIKQKHKLKFLLPIDSSQLSFILPPTLNTVLGLRWLIIKYQLYKESPHCKVSNYSLENLQNNPDKLLFFMRFCALFKWASIISQSFPDQLRSETEKNGVLETQKSKAKVGRPKKNTGHKVLNMMRAREKKNAVVQEQTNPVSIPIPYKSVRILPRTKPNPGTYPLTLSGLKAVKSESQKSGISYEYNDTEILEEIEDDVEIDVPETVSKKRKRNAVACRLATFDTETIEVVRNTNETNQSTAHFKILSNVPTVDLNTIKKLGLTNKNIVILDNQGDNNQTSGQENNTQIFKIITNTLDPDKTDIDIVEDTSTG